MDIVLQGEIVWINKYKGFILAEVEALHKHQDIDKVRPGQKVTIILEQRKSKKEVKQHGISSES